MAKTAMKIKQQRKPKFSTRAYTRCKICGRPIYSLQNLWSSTFSVKKIRNLQNLLP